MDERSSTHPVSKSSAPSRFVLDERAAGWQAGVGNLPFNPHASDDWKRGWEMQRAHHLRRIAAENDVVEIESLLQILGQACRRLAAKGEAATDLARAICDREFLSACGTAPLSAGPIVTGIAAALSSPGGSERPLPAAPPTQGEDGLDPPPGRQAQGEAPPAFTRVIADALAAGASPTRSVSREAQTASTGGAPLAAGSRNASREGPAI